MKRNHAASTSRKSAKRIPDYIRAIRKLPPNERAKVIRGVYDTGHKEYIPISMAPQTRRKCSFPPCGKKYHPRRFWQKYCSRKCRRDDWIVHHPMVIDPKPFK